MKLKERKIKKGEPAYIFSTVLESLLTGSRMGNNEVRQLTDGYISYNPNTDQGKETALRKGDNFFILLGDFRKELKNCKNSADCVKVYKQLIKDGAKVSLWSNYDYK